MLSSILLVRDKKAGFWTVDFKGTPEASRGVERTRYLATESSKTVYVAVQRDYPAYSVQIALTDMMD